MRYLNVEARVLQSLPHLNLTNLRTLELLRNGTLGSKSVEIRCNFQRQLVTNGEAVLDFRSPKDAFSTCFSSHDFAEPDLNGMVRAHLISIRFRFETSNSHYCKENEKLRNKVC